VLNELVRCPTCAGALDIDAGGARCGSGHEFASEGGVLVLLDPETLDADPQYAHQRQYFDTEFAAYHGYHLENWRLAYLQRLREAGLLGGDATPLVDVGVGGSGYTVIEAARSGAFAIGCDLSLDGLVRARRFAEAEGVAERTLWICCSAERLPLASGSFASALAIAVLEHVPDDGAALDELARVLKPGGRAWITVPHAMRHVPGLLRLPNIVHDRRLGHLRRYEAEELVAAAKSRGLACDDVQYTGHAVKVLQLPAPRWDRLWWWCERRDARQVRRRKGSLQLSVALSRPS
jgi:SAM-dependent methyltransferase